jgi:H-NS histone family
MLGDCIRQVFPKYRNPDQPAETWTGRGKQPRWLTAKLSSGKKLEHSRIQPSKNWSVGMHGRSHSQFSQVERVSKLLQFNELLKEIAEYLPQPSAVFFRNISAS